MSLCIFFTRELLFFFKFDVRIISIWMTATYQKEGDLWFFVGCNQQPTCWCWCGSHPIQSRHFQLQHQNDSSLTSGTARSAGTCWQHTSDLLFSMYISDCPAVGKHMDVNKWNEMHQKRGCTLMLRHNLPIASLIWLFSTPEKCRAFFICSAVLPLAPSWAMESTAATLNGETQTFPEGPAFSLTIWKSKKWNNWNKPNWKLNAAVKPEILKC